MAKLYIAGIIGGIIVLVAVAVLLWPLKVTVLTIDLPPVANSKAEAHASPAASSAPASLSADEQGLGTPEAFLLAIYDHYRSDAIKTDFSTFSDPSSYYDPDLAALKAENDRLYAGNIGAIEADPICQCQDWGPITTTIRIESQDARSATAIAILNMALEGVKPYSVHYRLVRIGGRWRIHDIGARDYPSLRRLIQDSNEDARKHPAEASSSS